jgi:hypothetical protein
MATRNLPTEIAGIYAAKTATYSITSDDQVIDCTANTFTVTLPTAVGITGKRFVIRNTGSGNEGGTSRKDRNQGDTRWQLS